VATLSLSQQCQRLFHVSNHDNLLVSSSGHCKWDEWVSDHTWRRHLFVMELDLISNLMNTLNGVN